MFREIYNDQLIRAIGIIENGELQGLVVTFLSVASRRLHYKTNSSMFVYKGRWFKGSVEIDTDNSIYLNVDKFGYIVVDGDNVWFKEIRDIERL